MLPQGFKSDDKFKACIICDKPFGLSSGITMISSACITHKYIEFLNVSASTFFFIYKIDFKIV